VNPFATKYVILETGDCGGRLGGAGATDYVVALDAENESIVWYLDLGAASGSIGAQTTGWRYQPGPTATSGRLIVLTDDQRLFEWSFDGTELLHYEFAPDGECDGVAGSTGPCAHHDVLPVGRDGSTHVLASALSTVDATGTDWETACAATGSRFVNDGIITIGDTGTLSSERYLMDDYEFDPTVYGGPNSGYRRGTGQGLRQHAVPHRFRVQCHRLDARELRSGLALRTRGGPRPVDQGVGRDPPLQCVDRDPPLDLGVEHDRRRFRGDRHGGRCRRNDDVSQPSTTSTR
jgi:hypothetical protein